MFDLEVMKWGGNKYWSRRVSKGSMWSLVSTLSRVVYWHQLYTLQIKNNLYWKEKLQVVFRFPAWTKNRQNPLKEWNRSPSTFHRLTRKPWHIGPMLRLTLIGSTFSQNASLNNWEKKTQLHKFNFLLQSLPVQVISILCKDVNQSIRIMLTFCQALRKQTKDKWTKWNPKRKKE